MYADNGNQHGGGNSENSDIAKPGVPLLADGDQSDLRQQQAQEQVAAALKKIDLSPLEALFGEFEEVGSLADQLLGDMGRLTGSLYNAKDPADQNTVVGAVMAWHKVRVSWQVAPGSLTKGQER